MFSDLRGKLNGSKFSKGRSSHTLTNKVKGSNPRSLTQTNVRSAFRKYSSLWQTLTPGQIAAWNSAAQDSSKRNDFGDSYKTTGHKLFIAYNTNAKLMGGSEVLDPVNIVVPTIPGIENFDADSVTQIISFDTTEALDVNTCIVVSATRQLSPGISNLNGFYRVVKIIQAPLAATTVIISSEYIAKFGALIKGKKIGLSVSASDSKKVKVFHAGGALAKAVN